MTDSRTFSDRMMANTRITPIQPQNRVKTVTKLADGNLAVELHSGQQYEIDKGDELFQAFVVYTMLADYT